MAFCWTLKGSHRYHCVYMPYTISLHHLPYCPLQSGVKWWISPTLQHLIAERRSWQDGRCCLWQTGRSGLTCGNTSDTPQTSDLLIVKSSCQISRHSVKECKCVTLSVRDFVLGQRCAIKPESCPAPPHVWIHIRLFHFMFPWHIIKSFGTRRLDFVFMW